MTHRSHLSSPATSVQLGPSVLPELFSWSSFCSWERNFPWAMEPEPFGFTLDWALKVRAKCPSLCSGCQLPPGWRTSTFLRSPDSLSWLKAWASGVGVSSTGLEARFESHSGLAPQYLWGLDQLNLPLSLVFVYKAGIITVHVPEAGEAQKGV